MQNTTRATLIGCVALLLWSTLAILTALANPIPPFQMVAMAFFVAALLAPIKWIARRESVTAHLKQPIGAWVLSVAGLFGYHFFYFVALRLAPPVEANLLNYLWPLLIVLFSALLPGARLGVPHVLGAACGLAGAVLLVIGPGAAFDPRYVTGYAAALACGVIWSAYSVANRRYKNVPSDAVGGFCAATAILAAICHFALEPTVTPTDWQWLVMLALGLGPVGGAFYVWDYGCKHGDIRALGTLAYGVPLVSNALLIATGRGVLDWRVAIAAVLIIGGAVIGTGLKRRAAEPTLAQP
ncbi:MAG TPA: EamA family transporter [Magnetospirillaceae bacterium]